MPYYLFQALWILLSPKSNFRRLLKHPLLQRMGVVFLLCCWAITTQSKPIKREDADVYRTKQVMYNDRVVPFNTLARDFVIKLTGKDNYQGLSPEQVLLGWLLYPDEWQNEPMIQIKNKEPATTLRMWFLCPPYRFLRPGERISFTGILEPPASKRQTRCIIKSNHRNR